MRALPALILILCAAVPAAAAPEPAGLSAALAAAARPMAIAVAGTGVAAPFAAAGPQAAAIGPDTPVRIASNTKTFVAATALRLWEQRRLDLDAPIGPLLTPALDTLLRGGGYDTAAITVRQLLSHSAGLYDHAADDRYLPLVLAQPGHRWTRAEQVRLAVTWGHPLAAPGTEFHYSDTGYILLGDIIERITGQSLAAAVRRQLRLDRLGLKATWWEVMEAPPRRAAPRAHQFIGSTDVTGLDASVDLYGGGGLVMSARDLATATAALFEGRLFARAATLQEMLWKGPHKGADLYRLGVFVKHAGGQDFYWHSGFWGTVAYYAPASGIAVAGVSNNQDAYRPLVQLVQQTAGVPAP